MLLGAVLSILSALSFSLNGAMARRGMIRVSANQGAFVTVLAGIPLFLLAALVSGQLLHAADMPVDTYLILAAAGVLHFGIGRNFNYRAIAAIGSARSQPIQALSIPYSILVAYIFLGETINSLMALGIMLIMVGSVVVVERAGRSQADPLLSPRAPEPSPPAFEFRPTEGYSSAVLAALCYGTSPILIRAALDGQADRSILGGAIAYAAAGVYVVATLARARNRTLIRAIDLQSMRLFFGAGFLVFMAQMLRFVALSLAPVAVVTPLQRLSSLFTLILAASVNRHLERINTRVVLSVFTSLIGTMILLLGQQTL